MRAHKMTAVLVGGVAAIGVGIAAAPAVAQQTPATPVAHVKKKPAPIQAADANRPPARVTVRKRSYLDPGTETKAHAEHYMDYAFPPGDPTFISPQNYLINFTRSPLPSCFDLAGFCR
jgi:hypothetical protein